MSASVLKTQEAINKIEAIRAIGDLMGLAVEGCCLEEGNLCSLGHAIQGLAGEALAILEPQEPAQEGFDLDLVSVRNENIFKDAEKLQDMASQIQFIAEALCHDLGIDLPPNIKEKIARHRAAQGVKTPDLSAQDPEPEPRKLNQYTPGLANAKVSLKAFWGYLEDLELAAEDPAKVSAWAEMIHDELGKCEAA
jgi:hypothetical protein